MRRNPRHKLRLTERDLWLLEGLSKMRFLTTRQLAKLYFNGARWYPNKRLRNLMDSGLIRAWVRNLAQENTYSITRAGVVAFRDPNASLHPAAKVPAGLDENLAHLLAINGVRTALALTLSQANAEIASWRSDWELRSHGRERVIPDGLFLIRWHGLKDQAYALEVDNNTKSAKNFIKKILAYSALRATGKEIYGISDPIILVVSSDNKWLERYRASVKTLRLNTRIWFTALEDLNGKGATSAIWLNGGEKKYSLRELTFCPYRKDRRTDESLYG